MSEEKPKWYPFWCPTGNHDYLIYDLDAYLNYIYVQFKIALALAHNRHERREAQQKIRNALVGNSKENILSQFMKDGFIEAECFPCKMKKSLEHYRSLGQDVVIVGDCCMDRELYEQMKHQRPKDLEFIEKSSPKVEHGY